MMIDINKLIIDARKAGNQDELIAYRNLKAKIQEFKTAKNAEEYTEAEEIKLISKMCKDLEKAILEFSEANRDDLIAEYGIELTILRKFLPEPVDTGKLTAALWRWVCRKNFYNVPESEHIVVKIPKNKTGEAVKFLKSEFPNVDGKIIFEIVSKYVD